MGLNDNYSKARATRKKTETQNFELDELSGKQKRRIKSSVTKSPILFVVAFALIVGAICGYFAFVKLSDFQMNSYKVNNVNSVEDDYVVVDVSAYKTLLDITGVEYDLEELYASLKLEDGGVTCKFFGFDVSSTVSCKYYYREDISHDVQTVDNVDVCIPGVYYIEYSSSHFAFQKTKLVRTIVVTGVEDNG